MQCPNIMQAYVDGADIINLSLGGATEIPDQSPIALVTKGLAQQGIIVVAAAGNTGDIGGICAFLSHDILVCALK